MKIQWLYEVAVVLVIIMLGVVHLAERRFLEVERAGSQPTPTIHLLRRIEPLTAPTPAAIEIARTPFAPAVATIAPAAGGEPAAVILTPPAAEKILAGLPVAGVVTQGFGCSATRNGWPGPDCPADAPWFHDGLDIGAQEGTPVRAALSGTVIYAAAGRPRRTPAPAGDARAGRGIHHDRRLPAAGGDPARADALEFRRRPGRRRSERLLAGLCGHAGPQSGGAECAA